MQRCSPSYLCPVPSIRPGWCPVGWHWRARLGRSWHLVPQVLHYVEKPSTFVSEIINCGIYLFTPTIFQHIGEVFQRTQQELLL